MPFDKDSIRQALAHLRHPTANADLAAAGAISKIAYCDGYASVKIAGANLTGSQRRSLTQQVTAAIREHAEQAGAALAEVHVEFVTDAAPAPAGTRNPEPGTRPSAPGHRPIPIPPSNADPANPLPDVKHIIAVGAGKGGVGKSTIAVNLAVGLARRGHAVGLMDGDIYGPSMPTMLGLGSLDTIVRANMLQPFFVHGVKAMTIGKLVDPEKPLIWRGPMAHGAFKQLVEQTEWGELDYLVIDLPPGTGDVSLTMAQMLRLTGAVVVCTPQRVAQDDAVRAARMFQQLAIEVLGVVENMSFFIADDGREYDLFGKGGAQLMAQRLGVPFLGAIPINTALRVNSDSGDPSLNFTDTSPRNRALTDALENLVTNVERHAALASLRVGASKPNLAIS
jgi:ATP-binding protein involved in chromosome partitioning